MTNNPSPLSSSSTSHIALSRATQAAVPARSPNPAMTAKTPPTAGMPAPGHGHNIAYLGQASIGNTFAQGPSSSPAPLTPVSLHNPQAQASGSGQGQGQGSGYWYTQMDPVRASVSHMLSKAYSMPCFSAAQAFKQLVQPTVRFQLALDALLPLLEHADAELPLRILVAFILYSLYTPHPITINPFKSALYATYVQERERAISLAQEGGMAPNEQLVWVLWKILRGDGNEIGPYSPTTLARSPLPPKLRATNLSLDDQLNSSGELDDLTYSHTQAHAQDNTARHELANNDFTVDSVPDNVRASGVPAAEPSIVAGARANGSGVTHAPPVGERDEKIAHGMKLLLAARERVLTLSEQRQLLPLIPEITSSPRMITSLDLHPIIALNPTLAHPLFVGLLVNAHPSPQDNQLPPHLRNQNGTLVSYLSPYLEILPFLPPTLPTFDLMGKLILDQTPLSSGPGSGSGPTISSIIRTEVLGRFIHESVNWIERAEREEREGMVSDDRVGKGVQSLCRFFNGLVKLGVVDLDDDGEGGGVKAASLGAGVDHLGLKTEMMHFCLRFARFEEANALYRVLAMRYRGM
ncbi:hypothetical protein AX16_002749 [Volvariella volvacea WC 439]|nr:hypothetical protein AX16_002749 [Volvariella volvacea WC 439]